MDGSIKWHVTSDYLEELCIGNESDLKSSCEVPCERADQFGMEFGIEMLETSAKSKENVLAALRN